MGDRFCPGPGSGWVPPLAKWPFTPWLIDGVILTANYLLSGMMLQAWHLTGWFILRVDQLHILGMGIKHREFLNWVYKPYYWVFEPYYRVDDRPL